MDSCERNNARDDISEDCDLFMDIVKLSLFTNHFQNAWAPTQSCVMMLP